MTTIPLPLSRRMRLGAPVFLLCMAGLVLMCRIVWPWRLAAAAALLLAGVLLWRHYLRRRPVSLSIETGGGLACTLADGHALEVVRILPGVVRPWLLCGRIEGRAGEHCDLFIPGGSLPETVHWQLRRALIGFRPVQPDGRRGT